MTGSLQGEGSSGWPLLWDFKDRKEGPRFRIEEEAVRAAITDGETFESPVVVNATGALADSCLRAFTERNTDCSALRKDRLRDHFLRKGPFLITLRSKLPGFLLPRK